MVVCGLSSGNPRFTGPGFLFSAAARTTRDIVCIGKIAAGYKRLPQADAHEYGAEKLLELCEVRELVWVPAPACPELYITKCYIVTD